MLVRDAVRMLLEAPMDAAFKILAFRSQDDEDEIVLDAIAITGPSDEKGPWVMQAWPSLDRAPVYSKVFPSFRFKCGLCKWTGDTVEDSHCPKCGELESITDYGSEGGGDSIPKTPANCVRMRIAVALWFDPKEGAWKSYAEGSVANKGENPKAWVEETLGNNRMNEGETVHWHWVEAWVPLPTDHEYQIEGTVSDDK